MSWIKDGSETFERLRGKPSFGTGKQLFKSSVSRRKITRCELQGQMPMDVLAVWVFKGKTVGCEKPKKGSLLAKEMASSFAPPRPQSPLPTTDQTLSLWNRRILTTLGCGFVLMSLAVFADKGVTGEAIKLSPGGIEGQIAWRQHNCVTCHQFFGMGGFLGPDLTNVVDRIGPETVAWVLRNGRGSMPALDLSEMEIDNLVTFLSEMNQTGKFPPNDWPPQWFPDAYKSLDTMPSEGQK